MFKHRGRTKQKNLYPSFVVLVQFYASTFNLKVLSFLQPLKTLVTAHLGMRAHYKTCSFYFGSWYMNISEAGCLLSSLIWLPAPAVKTFMEQLGVTCCFCLVCSKLSLGRCKAPGDPSYLLNNKNKSRSLNRLKLRGARPPHRPLFWLTVRAPWDHADSVWMVEELFCDLFYCLHQSLHALWVWTFL